MKVAFTMPGQGSQSIGMGKMLYDNFSCAKQVFDEVDDALDEKLSSLMFSGDIEELTLTYNAQPAIMAVSIAVIRVLESMGLDMSKDVQVVAGHSLGEYSALCAAGVYSLRDTTRLLRIRGLAMQNAVPQGVGAMCAIIGLEISQLEKICNQIKSENGICEIANDNGGGQLVLSGEKLAVEKAAILAKDMDAKRVVFLPVSAPFHCSLMKPAADKMLQALEQITPNKPVVPILPNITVNLQIDADAIAGLLVEQIVGRVRWRETVEWFAANDISHIYEIGWGKILTNLAKRINKELVAMPVYEIAEIENCLKLIQE